MAITNHERIGKALELLKAGLGPFVEREMKSTYGDEAQTQVGRFMGADRLPADKPVDQWMWPPCSPGEGPDPCHGSGSRVVPLKSLCESFEETADAEVGTWAQSRFRAEMGESIAC